MQCCNLRMNQGIAAGYCSFIVSLSMTGNQRARQATRHTRQGLWCAAWCLCGEGRTRHTAPQPSLPRSQVYHTSHRTRIGSSTLGACRQSQFRAWSLCSSHGRTVTGTVASVDAACMPAAPHQEPALGDRGPCLVELEAAPRKGRPSCRKCRPRRASSTTDSSTRPTVPRNPGSMRVHIPPPGLPRTPPPPRRDRVIPTPLRPAPLCTAPPLVPDPCPARSRLERAPSLPQASALARKRAPARRLGPGAAPGGGGQAGAGGGCWGGRGRVRGAGERGAGRRGGAGGGGEGAGRGAVSGSGEGGAQVAGPPSVALLFARTHTLFRDVPRGVLAAPASALCGWTGVILSLSPSLSLPPSLSHSPSAPPPPPPAHRASQVPGSPSPPINVLARNQRPGSHH